MSTSRLSFHTPNTYYYSTFCPVNNAGFVKGTEHVGSVDESDVEAMFATNVLGLISITQLLVKGWTVCPLSA